MQNDLSWLITYLDKGYFCYKRLWFSPMLWINMFSPTLRIFLHEPMLHASIPRRTFLQIPLQFLTEHFCQFLINSSPNIFVKSSSSPRRTFLSIHHQFLAENFCQFLFNSSLNISVNSSSLPPRIFFNFSSFLHRTFLSNPLQFLVELFCQLLLKSLLSAEQFCSVKCVVAALFQTAKLF